MRYINSLLLYFTLLSQEINSHPGRDLLKSV